MKASIRQFSGTNLSGIVNLAGGDLDEALDTVLLGSRSGDLGNINNVLLVDLMEDEEGQVSERRLTTPHAAWTTRNSKWRAPNPVLRWPPTGTEAISSVVRAPTRRSHSDYEPRWPGCTWWQQPS